jgi:hypothetical protein
LVQSSPDHFIPPLSNRFSKTILICLLSWLAICGISKKWQNPIAWDVFGYHLYLPATFIWHDPSLKDLSKAEAINATYHNTGTFYQGDKTGNGSWIIKYTMGLAVLEAPFFFAAHVAAPALGYPADGFSRPYQLALLVAHFFYLFFGLILLRRMLLCFFNDKITSVLLLLLVFGTNFYVQSLLTAGAAPVHIMEFFLLTAILYLTVEWHTSPSLKTAALLGISGALAALVRPADIIVLVIPLFWNVKTFGELASKIKSLVTRHALHSFIMLLCFVIVLSPQLFYWKTVAGKWILFSYANNPGEGFDFLSPHFQSVLFSFRKGWFIYTPLMFFAVAGFVRLYRENKNAFWSILVFFCLNMYVISSWSCWWYAGSFSQRAMVDSYGILLLPLGYLVSEIMNSSLLIKRVAIVTGILLVTLNLFQSWQYSVQILDGSRMTRAAWLDIFGKTNKENVRKDLLLIGRSTGEEETFVDPTGYKSRILFENNFDSPPAGAGKQYNDTLAHQGAFCLRLDTGFVFTAKQEAAFQTLTHKDHVWIRTTFWYYLTSAADSTQLALVMCFNHDGGLYKYTAKDVGTGKEKPKAGQWNKFVFDYLSPEVRSVDDVLNTYLWLRGKSTVYVDDLKVEVFEKK